MSSRIDRQARLSADEQVDETLNRTSSMLHTLATVACHSAACQHKAVVAVLQMAHERSLEHAQVLKVCCRAYSLTSSC